MLSRMLTRAQMALLCLGLFLALALCGAWQAFAWGRTQLDAGALVCADTLRLHIRAESDSIADQSAKLHVRDAVLTYMELGTLAGDGIAVCPDVQPQGVGTHQRTGVQLNAAPRQRLSCAAEDKGKKQAKAEQRHLRACKHSG